MLDGRCSKKFTTLQSSPLGSRNSDCPSMSTACVKWFQLNYEDQEFDILRYENQKWVLENLLN